MIKIVSPFGETNKSTFRRINPHVQYKSVEPLPMSSIAFVRDKKEILLTTIVNAENRLELDRLIHSTDTLLVEKMMATFDAWWNQVENTNARIEEKTHAELLLDLITHDIGNHNQIVAPNLELARMILDKTAGGNISLDEEDSEDLRQYLASATRAFDRSISLVDNIRRLEKMYREKNTKLTDQDLISAIESAISVVKNSTRNQKDISFSINFGGKEGPLVLADNLLEEIFVNLFNNAVKATEDGSVKIEVDVQQYTLGREKYWIVTVSDYGQGIPDDQKSELFARFYSKAKGTGLGLSIVRALIERYKGQVWVSDRVSGDYARGASFGMILHGTKA